MPDLPSSPKRGDDILAWAQQVHGYLRSLRPRSGKGTRVQWTAGGFSISTPPSRSADAVRIHPFLVQPDGDDQVRVVPGTVNLTIPSTVAGVDGEDWVFDASADEQYIVLRAAMAADGSVESSEISCLTELPEQPAGNTETGSAPSGSYRIVARITYAEEEDGGGMIIDNFLQGSQWVECVVSQWNCDEQTLRALWADQVALD